VGLFTPGAADSVFGAGLEVIRPGLAGRGLVILETLPGASAGGTTVFASSGRSTPDLWVPHREGPRLDPLDTLPRIEILRIDLPRPPTYDGPPDAPPADPEIQRFGDGNVIADCIGRLLAPPPFDSVTAATQACFTDEHGAAAWPPSDCPPPCVSSSSSACCRTRTGCTPRARPSRRW